MEAHKSNSSSSSSVEGFCDFCVWKRWQPTTHYQTCQGRANEIVSETMRTKGGDYRAIGEDAKRQILDEFCTDPNLDEDEDDDASIRQTATRRRKFCGDCLWKGTKYTCNAKVENMVDVYSVSRDKAIEAVLVDCIKGDDTNNASIVAKITSSTSFIAISALAFLSAITIYVLLRIGRVRDRVQTTTTSMKSKLGAGVIGLAFLSAIFGMQHQSIATDTRATTSSQKSDDAHITICNRRLYLKNMPPLPPNLEFGFPKDWDRSFSKPGGAIVLDSEFLYGRTGNNIREFFSAFDWARNEGVGLVVRERGFPMDKPLNELFMGLRRSHLENVLGFTFFDHVKEDYRSNLRSIRTGKLFYYGRTMKVLNINQTKSRREQIEHRHYILQEFYRFTAREMELSENRNNSLARKTMLGMCHSLRAIFGSDGQGAREEQLRLLGFNRTITEEYTAIHSRSFEGAGIAMMEKSEQELGVSAAAYTDLPPQMVKDLLAPLEMNKNSILLITDGENTRPIENLSSDPIIGPRFEVVPPEISTMISDGMLAILSTVFIGNPYSTYSQFIAQVRYALGIGPSYLFIKMDNDTKKWTAFCDDEYCFYNFTLGWP
eukprot:CAMPEP_0172544276 /NCGR_PEP_ID=MMETSP1067-20121228/14464_1 /TAXON_ID=265564 ORGANISM="Thalassiosira punctigera, Strain Tpunct2005C2" /NCGR_SAMPLE_ID=MMETSP1067 /ASSEMBLY_ACC=CAM_ASM_000444 /LENGTH=601 /DNA_ID=CAMNT_0013330805 /DNA_START=111 /DNA_END=1916 /DNA_ORIENTATION=+